MGKYGALGVLSLLGTYVFLVVVAYLTGAYPIVFQELGQFLDGNLDSIIKNHTSFLMMIAVIIAVITLQLPMTLIISNLMEKSS